MNQLPLHFRVNQKAAQTQDRFLELLLDGDWHKGSWLALRLHTSDRVVRLCADRSGGRVISGQEGYKLTRYATTDEIDHAEAWLLSQARKMTERAVEIRKCRNRGAAA
jgi:hypothetical protein